MRRRYAIRIGTGVVLLLGTIALTSCNIFLDTGDQTLRVVNATSYSLERVVWIDGDGYRHTFGPDQAGYLLPGSSEEERVAPGYDFVYFYFVNLPDHFRTAEPVEVRPFRHVILVIDDGTPVVKVP